jgi:cytoskeletal protein RodZ
MRMALEKSKGDSKDKSNDEKKALAGGIALTLVVILFIVWSYFFFKRFQREGPQDFGDSAQSTFESSTVREAKEAILKQTTDLDELRALREQGGGAYQPTTAPDSGEGQDPFEGSGGL